MILDLTDPAHPLEVGRWWMPGQWTAGGETPTWKGRNHRCHHPVETITGNEVPAAWFASGLRVIDIANPLAMRQAAWWMPGVPSGAQRVCSNDVCVDERGLIYLVDRNRDYRYYRPESLIMRGPA